MLVSVSTESSREGCEQQGDIRDCEIRFLLMSLRLTSSDSTPTHGVAPHIMVVVLVVVGDGGAGYSSVAVSHLTYVYCLVWNKHSGNVAISSSVLTSMFVLFMLILYECEVWI